MADCDLDQSVIFIIKLTARTIFKYIFQKRIAYFEFDSIKHQKDAKTATDTLAVQSIFFSLETLDTLLDEVDTEKQ